MAAAAVVYVKGLAPMRAFYERCFGMSPVESDGDDFCVLASDDWTLSLVSVPEPTASTITITEPPHRRAETPVKLAFEVTSIEALRPVVAGTGGRIDPIDAAWEFRGHRHVDCLDPEGNIVQLRERVPGE